MAADPYRKISTKLNVGTLALLKQLAGCTDQPTVKAMAQRTGRAEAAVRKIFVKAEALGLVSMRSDDGRWFRWCITDAGRAAAGVSADYEDLDMVAVDEIETVCIQRGPSLEGDSTIARAVKTQPRWVFDLALF